MDEPYVCTLDEATQKKAKEELNEIPSDRMSAVQALRDWVNSQPHIIAPPYTDAQYIMILRGAKFSQLRARQIIEGGLTVKREAPEWMNNIDPRDLKVQAVIDDGYAVPLPKRTKDGCQILFYRIGNMDPTMKRYSHADTIKAAIVVGSYISKSELTQVNGSVFVMDFTGMTAKHMANQMSLSDLKKFSKLWQKNAAGRFKMFHYYNAGTFFEAVMALMKPFLDKKYIERIKTHDNLVSLYKYVSMELLPDEYLPDDYKGPSAGPMKQIIENYKKEITNDEFRDLMLGFTDSKYGIDESKRPKQDESMQQSFRKLNVD